MYLNHEATSGAPNVAMPQLGSRTKVHGVKYEVTSIGLPVWENSLVEKHAIYSIGMAGVVGLAGVVGPAGVVDPNEFEQESLSTEFSVNYMSLSYRAHIRLSRKRAQRNTGKCAYRFRNY